MATAEYSSVQGELGDVQKRLAPHLRMRVDYEQNVEGMEEMYVVTKRCHWGGFREGVERGGRHSE